MDDPDKSQPLALVLPETLDQREAAPLATRFLTTRGGQVRIDASLVKKIGIQCMQVIVSAFLTWERDGYTLTIAEPSNEFIEAFALAGINLAKFTERQTPQ